jgi:biotin carboxylase
LVRNFQDLDRSRISLPILIKPTQGENGKEIEKISTDAELRHATVARANSPTGGFIIQSFVAGSDIDISMLADHGRVVAWTIQQRAENGVMRLINRTDILELGQNLVRKTNYHGVIHLDLRIDRNGKAFFVDANPRFWGSLKYSVWSGVNFLELGLQMMEGRDLSGQFTPIVTDCPNIAITSRSLRRALLGGWPAQRGRADAQRRSGRFLRGIGNICGFGQALLMNAFELVREWWRLFF